ncbi:ASCH domain-containing protein [Sporosarcina sp. Te-1]|uniref:ASCH domain-containing protein n=1 Tax=Sporosarcina sp. Te-1 TaxID=2818390 RepID=UPI001A9E4189|nr:ASCH domain-containing protein [Sporosarcina sp. Te-1]QTD42563.1 ASCH domain-containing protein [Sporosarcina sp. Te-1]
MNAAAKKYWDAYWGTKERPNVVSAWMFGDSPDELAQKVLSGKKTATCSAYALYEVQNEPLPQLNEYSIILNSLEEPVAMIKTTDVSLIPFCDVEEEFALAEGEGSYEEWKQIHERYFKEEMGKVGLPFSNEMLLVCERFVLVDDKGGI